MRCPLAATAALLLLCSLAALAEAPAPKGWIKGKGYGWVYGPKDEAGSLNAINNPTWVLRAMQSVKLIFYSAKSQPVHYWRVIASRKT